MLLRTFLTEAMTDLMVYVAMCFFVVFCFGICTHPVLDFFTEAADCYVGTTGWISFNNFLWFHGILRSQHTTL